MRFKRPLFLTSAILIPLFAGATAPRFVDQIRTFTTSATQPFLELQSYVTHFVKTEAQQLAAWPTLRKENEILKAEVQNLKEELNRFEEKGVAPQPCNGYKSGS